MPWLYWVAAALLIVVAVYPYVVREKLTMLSEHKEVDGWGNVIITP